MTPANPKPADAPARVDCTKWDTPMAVAAHRMPGPNATQRRPAVEDSDVLAMAGEDDTPFRRHSGARPPSIRVRRP